MGTADADRALRTAKLVGNDVAGIDVNMGCPKPFSIKGGMGAALLSQPERIRDILTALVKGLPEKRITCKIRLLPTEEATLSLAKLIESTGVAALGVHGRLQAQRPREPVSEAQAALIKKVASSLSIPVIANGGSLDIKAYSDLAPFQATTGCTSVMLARAAQWNMSVFRPEGLLPTEDVVRAYLRLAAQVDNPWENSKFCIMTTLHHEQVTERGKAVRESKSLREMCAVFGIEKEYDAIIAARRNRAAELGIAIDPDDDAMFDGSDDVVGGEPNSKRRRLTPAVGDDGVTRLKVVYNRKEHAEGMNPKSLLLCYCKKQMIPPPAYTCSETAMKRFVAVVDINGNKYGATPGESTKKKAEQAAAQVFLIATDLKLNRDGTVVGEEVQAKAKEEKGTAKEKVAGKGTQDPEEGAAAAGAAAAASGDGAAAVEKAAGKEDGGGAAASVATADAAGSVA